MTGILAISDPDPVKAGIKSRSLERACIMIHLGTTQPVHINKKSPPNFASNIKWINQLLSPSTNQETIVLWMISRGTEVKFA